jgi:hypothetical protein
MQSSAGLFARSGSGLDLLLNPLVQILFDPADSAAASEFDAGREFPFLHQLVDLGFLDAGFRLGGVKS